MSSAGVELVAGGTGGRAIDVIADGVDRTRSAVMSTQVPPGTYGALCGFLPPLLDQLQDIACTMLGEEAAALQSTAGLLTAAERRIADADADAAEQFDRIVT